MTKVMIGHFERRGEFGILKMDDDSTLAIILKYVLDAGMRLQPGGFSLPEVTQCTVHEASYGITPLQ